MRDFNEKGYEVLINLIKVLASNEDGYHLGDNFNFNANKLRMAPKRHDITRTIACQNRRNCQGIWNDGQCHPRNNNVIGFPGIYPHSGQKTHTRNISHTLGSQRNSKRHGKYSKPLNSRILWRKPGRLRKI